MGVHGWTLRRDIVELRGTGVSTSLHTDDMDWNFNVRPLPGFEHLLVNAMGNRSTNGEITCEVEPPDDLGGGEDAEDERVVFRFLKPAEGLVVYVVGSHVDDRSHDVFGNDIIVPTATGIFDRPEIHPMFLFIAQRPREDGSQELDILAFSDDSGGAVPTNVPNDEMNFVADVDLAVYPATAEFRTLEEKAQRARLVFFDQIREGEMTRLRMHIETGTPDEGNGFYFTRLHVPAAGIRGTLTMLGHDPANGVRAAMTEVGVTTFRELVRILSGPRLVGEAQLLEGQED